MFTDTISPTHRAAVAAPSDQSATPLRPILLRAGVVALVIGSALTLINQSSALFGAARLEVLPLALVFLTPFVVVAISQILGFRQAGRDLADGTSSPPLNEPFLATVTRHGIPFRAVLLGLAAGGVNTSATLTAQLIAGGATGGPPVAVIAQAFALPILFGVLSQALSYRRALATSAVRATS